MNNSSGGGGDTSEKSQTTTTTTTTAATPVQGGGKTEKYRWTQEISSIMMVIPVPPGTRAKQLNIEIKQKHLTVGIRGSEPIINGELHKEVNVPECMWQLEDNKEVIIHLQKKSGIFWKFVLEGDPEVDITQIEPPQAKLSDLDGEVRATVEKMLYDQNAKALGLPTSEDRLREVNIRRLQQMHPNVDWSKMDLSKAEINFQ